MGASKVGGGNFHVGNLAADHSTRLFLTKDATISDDEQFRRAETAQILTPQIAVPAAETILRHIRTRSDVRITRAPFEGQHAVVGRKQRVGCRPILPLSVGRAEEFPLVGPVGWEFDGETHEALCAEMRRMFAVDNGRDDIGR